ncbi:autotransporter outer membrane beta-barrel domain-containing protein, partial [Bordetella sp. 02P26C-1]|uniref:autotransporter outer membrane beta-barrel domain-containing protein n=1 Tax=Bordetella sp. 02P26C-1 TaxID=2683195 RepID=UPI0013561A20
GGGTGGAGNSSSKLLEQDSHAMQISVGGNGGLSGSGGAINASFGTATTTSGDRAYGLLVQSIGAGGGLAGAGQSSNLTAVNLGGRNGASGNGGAVTVNLNAGSTITTAGAGAHALIAQSIGGGGGIAGDTAMGVQLNGADWIPTGVNADGTPVTSGDGDGGVVDVTSNANLSTTGANAFGILAQSIGGGGGLGGSANGGFAGSTGAADGQGRGQDVTVTQNGTIKVSGQGATGIFAQSAGPQGSGTITVNVNGTVIGGTGTQAYGVWIAGDGQNVLNVGADAQIVAGDGGSAVRGDGAPVQQSTVAMAKRSSTGALAVNNAGLIQGNIECQGGGIVCDVRNMPSGTLSHATLYQANVDNAGRLIIGTPGSFGTLTIDGELNLRPEGFLQADVDFAAVKAPQMIVQGNARLDGQVDVRPVTLLPDRAVTLATVQGDIQGMPSALDSPVVNYDAQLQGQQLRVRAASADFAAPSMQLKDNPRAVAGHLQSAWDLGGNPQLAPLFASLDMASRQGSDAYAGQLSDLSPGAAVAPAAQMQASMARFNNAMMSCPKDQIDDPLSGEQDCVWGQVTSFRIDQDGSGGVAGFKYDGINYQVGGQRQVSPGWFLGGSVAYQNTHLRGDDGRVSGKGDSGYAGVVLKRETGPWTFSAALSGGYGQFDIDRRIRIPGQSSTASSNLDVYGAGLRLRAARTFASEQFYVKPYVDLDAFYTHMPRYRESSNNLHLDVDSSNEFIVGLSPTLEAGAKLPLNNGAVLRPFAYAGVTFLSKDEYTAKARLQGAPAGASAFKTSVPMDDVIGRVGAGLQVTNAGGVDFRLQYDGDFSSHIQSHRASLRVMVPF